ncbi:uncharacterized protein LOC6561656 [Drosophila grimshawi]|uniref:GH10419 n=1 Tax=Drosophila grimshawi TaxID=7222 RepID=B4JE80_DROGR|nr:uncharacterized protein LOC6561656 [Drosophila grimshawi]EDW03600.1 GH10419 [Drosophila grimshawi]
MLARKYELSPRMPLVHEKIALQCALNISKLASSLPKPRNRFDELPVLVELRRCDEDVLYRYQVNLPASCLDPEPQQMNAAEVTALTKQLQLPCIVHGYTKEHGSSAQNTLIMLQEAVHVVHNRERNDDSQPGINEAISTFQCSPFACKASQRTQDHFMAALHQYESRPLASKLLSDRQSEEHNTEDELQPHLYQVSQGTYISPNNGIYNGYSIVGPPIRHQFNEPQKTVNSPKSEQQQPLKLLNGYKSTRYPNYNHNDNRHMYREKKAGNCNQLSIVARVAPSPPQSKIRPSNGYNPSIPNSALSRNLRDNRAKQLDPMLECASLRNAKTHGLWMAEMQASYGFLPRVDNYGQQIELQRELQLRRKRDQDIQHQKLIEQRVHKDSQLISQVPQELQSLFQWDSCRLCHTALTSKRNALDHYLSRTHLRRVETWLIQNSFGMGNLSEEMLRHLRSSGPAILHCDLCDLKLSSMLHAWQHFCGRRHRLVERRISKPNGEGYYDKAGNWVRTNDKWLMCHLCDVIVTSESQLGLHMAGLRHRKRERSNFGSSSTDTFDGSFIHRITGNGTLVPLNPFGTYMYAGRNRRDIHMMDDVNANYYCELCNKTLNHKKSAQQHVEGRAHSKKLERNKQETRTVCI